MYQKSQLSDVQFLLCGVRQRIFVILGHFLPFYPLIISKIKILKNWKKTWRYYPFTHEYYKCWSYNAWFLKYKVQQTKLLVLLGHYLSFHPLKTWKIQILKNWKKHLEILSFYKRQSYDVWFLIYGTWQTKFFVILDYFFTLLPP